MRWGLETELKDRDRERRKGKRERAGERDLERHEAKGGGKLMMQESLRQQSWKGTEGRPSPE